MSRFKYQVQQHVTPTVAPLSAAIGLALGATSLQAATITVTTLNDGSVPGQCTLRDALLSANGDFATAGCSAGSGSDDIVFQPGLTGTVTLTGGALSIDSTLSITGPGPGQLTISGDGSDRLIAVNPAAMAEISGLRLENGTINDLFGGAALVAVSSTVSLSNCEIANNASGSASYGGAISLNSSELTLDQCTLSGNTVAGGMILRGSSNAFGAGVLAVNSQLTITDSTFQDNAADLYGGGLALVNSSASIASSNFEGNDALIGGAISLGENSVLDMSASFVTGNTAYGGGGLAVGSLSYALVTTTEIYNNNAVYSGGGALVGVGYAPSMPLPEPSAGDAPFGGPSFSLNGPGQLLLEEAYIAFNSTTGSGGGLTAKYDSGVAIYSSGVRYNEAAAPSTPLSAGHWLQGGMPGPEPRGGGLAALNDAYIEAFDINLSVNYSELGGGGFADNGGLLRLDSSIISDNTANLGGGLLAGAQDPPVTPLDQPQLRGGSYAGGTLEVVDSLIDGNEALNAGGIASAYGAAALIKYSTISNNRAEFYGGGALAYESSLILASSLVQNNESTQGGGVWARGADNYTIIAQSTVSGNLAIVAGGLDLQSSSDRVKYSTISDNSAQGAGGVLIRGAPLSDSGIINSTITGNTAEEIGGLYARGVSLDFLTVSHNTSTGAPVPRDSRLGRGSLSENPGGALLSGDGDVDNSIFADNTSPGGMLDLSIDSPGVLTIDYSLIESPGAGVGAGTGNLIGLDPQLGILAANGGATLTRAIGPGSPALDSGDPATTVSNDQRGQPYPRVFNGRADMGAFEFFIDDIFDDRFEQP